MKTNAGPLLNGGENVRKFLRKTQFKNDKLYYVHTRMHRQRPTHTSASMLSAFVTVALSQCTLTWPPRTASGNS